jgi:hypothetical protein
VRRRKSLSCNHAIRTVSEPRQIEFCVGALPGRLELTAHEIGGLVLALREERLFEPKQTPTIPRPALEVFTEDLFRLCRVAGLQKRRS